ncbi:hypothetical protein J3R30DRAFT_3479715 [Lentinula aciculospora]|uniref:Uncharacterized protein n=1 Tax=Lentinula aciculospora TaxID=153920 RepID=A0A9W9AA84_9AGAR|nr:hypothetical protein J3R30DRAFT_3479715 [Lentinula aciculospora]
MLGIIQELVEETSQWDDSLFMDDSFKALIDNSRSTSSDSPLASSKSSRQSSVPLEDKIPLVPGLRNSGDSVRHRTRSSSSDVSAKSEAQSLSSNVAQTCNNPASNPTSDHTTSTIGTERKSSPKSILKKSLMMPSRSVEFELGLVDLEVVKMESFRMSAYESPKLYGSGYDQSVVNHVLCMPVTISMPGAYEHGSVLTPLHESNEEEEEQVVQRGVQGVGLAW